MYTIRNIEAKITALLYYGSRKVIYFVLPQREPDSGLKKTKNTWSSITKGIGDQKSQSVRFNEGRIRENRCIVNILALTFNRTNIFKNVNKKMQTKSKWSSNSLIQGSYTYVPPGISVADIKNLAVPIVNYFYLYISALAILMFILVVEE